MSQEKSKKYWNKNLQYLAGILTVWFIVSLGFSVLLVDQLDQIKVLGFKLGFWFAQQGSIIVFVILLILYRYLMNNLDKKFGYDQDDMGETR